MKPGPELDDLIAEKVMGIVEEDACDCIHPGPPPRYKYSMENDACLGCLSPRIEEYSTSMSAAWEVVENIQKTLGYLVEISGYKNAWQVIINQHIDWVGDGDTAPHAICLAALKAVGVDIDSLRD